MRLHKFRNRSHFSRDAERICEKTYYSHVPHYWTGSNTLILFIKTEYPSSSLTRLPELSWISIDYHSNVNERYKAFHEFRGKSRLSIVAKRIY
ncbi:hypothetical protein T265_08474 [Opisthorchis viverrini]|uniref:Uncharacterized protein n=1 Tax=Opisthorchis viverrini TaxID=6198 RepID=A0A075A8D0_OPIVI|nr:hypothetical protein T265_08474 [Opisthorchis viverrini]KER23709.1 hypothetical protein T265_08474 [Opisthorchis viverrini]